MSLGLNDLKKRATKEKPAAEPSPYLKGAGAWSKPWTASELASNLVSDLAQAKQNRKTSPNLTSDWTLLYSGPVFWVDWSELTWLARMQSRLSFIERQAERSVLRPIRNLRSFMKI